jgi:hypothetical protein
VKSAVTVLCSAVLLGSLAACSGTTPLPQNTGGGGGTAGGAGQGMAGTMMQPTAGMSTGGQASAGMSGTGGAGSGGGGGGGAGGSAGASAGSGGSAGGGGAGGGSGDGWVKIFNGQDLTGWIPLIHKSPKNENTYNTFSADPTNQVLKVSYDEYPDNRNFDGRCGLIYYDRLLTDYRVRVTYRFVEPQATNPVDWGKNNTGLMIFGIHPSEVMGDPEFPPIIEIQLLGANSAGGSTNINLCPLNGMTMAQGQGSCGNNGTGVAPLPADQWVTVEAEVLVEGETKVYQHPDLTDPVLTISGPRYQGQPVTGGYLALQSESQPVEYKDIEIKELP